APLRREEVRSRLPGRGRRLGEDQGRRQGQGPAEGPDRPLAERNPLERRDPLRRFVQAGYEVKLAAAGHEEGLARGDADFFQRLKAVGNESGADDVYALRSCL